MANTHTNRWRTGRNSRPAGRLRKSAVSAWTGGQRLYLQSRRASDDRVRPRGQLPPLIRRGGLSPRAWRVHGAGRYGLAHRGLSYRSALKGVSPDQPIGRPAQLDLAYEHRPSPADVLVRAAGRGLVERRLRAAQFLDCLPQGILES